jgi:hypothetical protein
MFILTTIGQKVSLHFAVRSQYVRGSYDITRQRLRFDSSVLATFGQMLGLDFVVLVEKVRQVAHVGLKLEGHGCVAS